MAEGGTARSLSTEVVAGGQQGLGVRAPSRCTKPQPLLLCPGLGHRHPHPDVTPRGARPCKSCVRCHDLVLLGAVPTCSERPDDGRQPRRFSEGCWFLEPLMAPGA